MLASQLYGDSFLMYMYSIIICVTVDKPDAIASELVGAKLIDAKNLVVGNGWDVHVCVSLWHINIDVSHAVFCFRKKLNTCLDIFLSVTLVAANITKLLETNAEKQTFPLVCG